MQAFMSAVHGVMDLEVGCVWRNYGDIYYLTDDQMSRPAVHHAIQRKWLIAVSDAEVRYASMDSKKVVGPKPAPSIKSSVVTPVPKGDTQLDNIKRDIAKINLDIQGLATAVNSIVDLLAKGIPVVGHPAPVGASAPSQMAALSEDVVEELFIPSFRTKESVSIEADAESVSDEGSDKALQELKKMRKKKNG